MRRAKRRRWRAPALRCLLAILALLAAAAPADASAQRRLTRKVFGYYPYWASSSTVLRWDLLSTFAYFASELDGTGTITNHHGWGGATVGALVQAAKRAGVKAVVTVTLFNQTGISSVLGTAESRATAIANIIEEVKRGAGEGVNIDFEFVPKTQKANFVAFMTELTTRMHAEIPGSEVTLAAPSVDWSGAYDYDQLAIHTDGIMIMAYGYHWTGGAPGPLAPLETNAPWTGRSLTWTVEDYFQYGGIENRAKYILGLPFYGNDWPTTSDAVPGTSRGTGHAVVYSSAVQQAARYVRRFDVSSSTPYYVYQATDGWRQGWYDDAESLGKKLDLINERDLGGLGIWALGYDGNRPELFDTIAEKLSVPATVEDGGTPVEDGGTTPEPDAGVSPEPDAGVSPEPDAGTVDPGHPWPDGGPAVEEPDAGVVRPPPGGGGCQGLGDTAQLPLVALALFLAVWMVRRS